MGRTAMSSALPWAGLFFVMLTATEATTTTPNTTTEELDTNTTTGATTPQLTSTSLSPSSSSSPSVSFSPTTSSTPVPPPSPTSDSSDLGPGIGIGIGIMLFVVAVVAVVLALVLWRRNWRLPCSERSSENGPKLPEMQVVSQNPAKAKMFTKQNDLNPAAVHSANDSAASQGHHLDRLLTAQSLGSAMKHPQNTERSSELYEVPHRVTTTTETSRNQVHGNPRKENDELPARSEPEGGTSRDSQGVYENCSALPSLTQRQTDSQSKAKTSTAVTHKQPVSSETEDNFYMDMSGVIPKGSS